MWQVGPFAAPDVGVSGFMCYPHCPTAQHPINGTVPEGDFLKLTEVCDYMGGPAGWLGHSGERGLYLN